MKKNLFKLFLLASLSMFQLNYGMDSKAVSLKGIVSAIAVTNWFDDISIQELVGHMVKDLPSDLGQYTGVFCVREYFEEILPGITKLVGRYYPEPFGVGCSFEQMEKVVKKIAIILEVPVGKKYHIKKHCCTLNKEDLDFFEKYSQEWRFSQERGDDVGEQMRYWEHKEFKKRLSVKKEREA